MLYREKFGILDLDGCPMEYLRFGTGRRILVMLPGLGDSLRSMKGMALPTALVYRMFCKDFTVYVFGRKQGMPEGSTIRGMAHDLAKAMAQLGIDQADVLGVSMGGMIAQWLAIDHPERVGRLILTVTAARPTPVMAESIEEWVACARSGDHAAFMESNLRRIYSPGYCRKNRWMVPVLGMLTKPKSYDPFFIQAAACLNHDAWEDLPRIRAATLVIGGEQDASLGGEPSREIAARIPGAELKMYQEWGHGLYEEARDFNAVVLEFLERR